MKETVLSEFFEIFFCLHGCWIYIYIQEAKNFPCMDAAYK